MKTLFIDTNVFLSFYHLTNEDLEELRKVLALIDTNQIELVVTKQVRDEFRRNRAGKIADAMKKLQDARFGLSFPAFTKDYSEYHELRDLLRKADKKHAELVAKVTEHANDGVLKADELINDLFEKATLINSDDKLYLKALERVRTGNPPGKENSLGDAINWECLLKSIDEFVDLYLVSGDQDYRCQLSPNRLNNYLQHEWQESRSSTTHFYSKISDFFKSNFPNIKIASEVERDVLIKELARSGSFAQTHAVIARLVKQTDFSPLQIEELVEIAQSNNQIGWIIEDDDVHQFYAGLQKLHLDQLKPEIVEMLKKLLEKKERSEISFDLEIEAHGTNA